jgi:hypothetical protein
MGVGNAERVVVVANVGVDGCTCVVAVGMDRTFR